MFEAMLVGFANRQLSRELKLSTIRMREKILRRFVAFSDAMPWEWTPAQFEQWSAMHVRGGRTLSTVRSYQGTVARLVDYITDLGNDWVEECERRFGRAPVVICGEHNMVRRNTEYEGVPDGNRPLSKEELARFFTYANERVEEARKLQRKGALAAYRDAVLYLVIYAWGLRRNEVAHLKVTVVAAAGNDGANLAGSTPAAYPEVLTVTAMSDFDGKPGGQGVTPPCKDGKEDDAAADFSDYATPGSAETEHTIAAPGVCIRSTWNDGGTKTISGTSMASPHVAGLVARCIEARPCAGLTPAQIIAKLRRDAASRAADQGFYGDPDHPIHGKYYGYLASDVGY